MGDCCAECAEHGGSCQEDKSVMARNREIATRGRLGARGTSPGGQVLGGNTVDALAMSLGDPWMPDTAAKYSRLIDCLLTPPNTAQPRPECAATLQFVAKYGRYYTAPDGGVSIVMQPLRSGDPWLDVPTWLNRYWDRMTPDYHTREFPQGLRTLQLTPEQVMASSTLIQLPANTAAGPLQPPPDQSPNSSNLPADPTQTPIVASARVSVLPIVAAVGVLGVAAAFLAYRMSRSND